MIITLANGLDDFDNAVSIHMAGWRIKNRYVNICIYVDSLRLLAAIPPTTIVAQLVVRWAAVLHFLGSGFKSRYGEFFVYFVSFFLCFVIKFVFHFATFSLIQKKHQGDVAP